MRKIELLSPAGNVEIGKAAIDHGADAVYIGAPKFSARSAAANGIDDIRELVTYAHSFYARVYAALNTLLDDEEIEEAVEIIHHLYDAGIDAVIIQDMGLLECDLPPIALHASTQMDNRDSEKVSFLEQVGFEQVVLARELSLEQIRTISRNSNIKIECFVHGALCVAYSGQCYISEVVAGRSANKGRCAQFCRHRYRLTDEEGHVIGPDKYYLSLKDLNLANHLQSMIAAGVSSFKIEGRLKESSYVKNVTAHYRLLLDEIIDNDPSLSRGSSGKCSFSFQPDPRRTFNRGSTDYFLVNPKNRPGSLATPKFVGYPIGIVKKVHSNHFEIETSENIVNGDGLGFFDQNDQLHGFRANRVEGSRIFVREKTGVRKGDILYRNNDSKFIQQLAQSECCRTISLQVKIVASEEGVRIEIEDEDGVCSVLHGTVKWQQARQKGRTRQVFERQFKKTGSTLFRVESFEIRMNDTFFLAVAKINKLRRIALEHHALIRSKEYIERVAKRPGKVAKFMTFPETKVACEQHITNEYAKKFFQRHGVCSSFKIKGDESQRDKDTLMTTKYCLRRQLKMCPKNYGERQVPAKPLFLTDNSGFYEVCFDCGKCEMRMKKSSLT